MTLPTPSHIQTLRALAAKVWGQDAADNAEALPPCDGLLARLLWEVDGDRCLYLSAGLWTDPDGAVCWRVDRWHCVPPESNACTDNVRACEGYRQPMWGDGLPF